MFPAIHPCMSIAFYEVLFLKHQDFLADLSFVYYFYLFSFCAVKVAFALVLWGRRTVSLQFPCCYSLRGRACPSVMAGH